jgi:glycosyltransferase involved in cell wall biosynthesis
VISVLVPAFNEADRIAATITAIRSLAGEKEVIVIDDGSTDNTAIEADKADADAILKREHVGKGDALNAGLAVATGSILVLLDADIGETAVEAVKLVKPIKEGTADMTIAVLPHTKSGGGMGIVVRLARWGIQKLTGRSMDAPLSGQRALTREMALSVGGFAPGWGAEVALTVNAIRNGYRVVEVPAEIRHRVTGRSPADIRHRWSQFVGVARTLWALWRAKNKDNTLLERH